MVLVCCFTQIKFTKLKNYGRTFNTWLLFHKNTLSSSNNSLINKDLCCESYHAAKSLIILNILLILEQISRFPGCVHECVCVCVYMDVQVCVSIWVCACKYGWVVYMNMYGFMSVSFVWVWIWVYTVYGCMWVYECLWIYECVCVWVWVYYVHECVCAYVYVCVKVRVGENKLIIIYNTNSWTLCCCSHYDGTAQTFINGYCTLSESWRVLHHQCIIFHI